MKLGRRGVSNAFNVVMLASFIAIVVAAALKLLDAQWAVAAAAGPPTLAAAFSAWQGQEARRKPDDKAEELAKSLSPKLLGDRTAEMPHLGLDVNHRIGLRWRVGVGSNPGVQRTAGLADTGTLDQLVDAIGRMADSGELPRVVVTGVMGGGKTAACHLLTVDLAERHGRLPVFLHLATWDPATPLQTWIAEKLPDDFPSISRSKYGRQVASFLTDRHILPILDGLDEMREPMKALRVIDEQMSGRPFVLTGRTAEFHQANAGGVLHQALIVDLQPLPAEEVRDILLEYEPASVHGPLSTFVAALEADPTGPVARALDTPLMVSLARDAGSPVPDLTAIATGQEAVDAIRRHLLGTFLRKAYASEDQATRDEARRYLAFLAKHTDGAGRIAWWLLYQAVPQALFLIVAIVNAGVACSALGALFFALFKNPWLGFWIGLVVGVIGAVIVALAPQQAPRRAQPSLRSLGAPTPIELLRAIGFGVIGGAATSLFVWALFGSVRYLVIGATLSAVTFAVAGYIGQPNDPLKVVTPGSLLNADRMTVVYAALLGATSGALTGGYMGLAFRAGHRPRFDSLPLLHNSALVLTLLGAAAGLVLSGAGLGLMAMGTSSWGRFLLTRIWLASRGSLPFDLMSFLSEAYKHGVLRQANGYYEFRHQSLQRYLTDADSALPAALASPAAPS